MESILSVFIFHDSYVVSFLVFAITIIVVLLLLFNHKSPKSVIRAEVDGEDNVEGALRRVLSERQWVGAGSGDSSIDQAKLSELENEVLNKDRAIAELNKQLTQGGGGLGTGDADSDLLQRIAELEERLQEYEIIEDDIADLSLYRTENEKLKGELARLKSLVGAQGGSLTGPEPVEANNIEVISPSQNETKIRGADLVAEFEKVVNNQDQIKGEVDDTAQKYEKKEINSGKVVVTGGGPTPNNETSVHPKLKNINPDSKEEAEVFINDLKTLKDGLKSE